MLVAGLMALNSVAVDAMLPALPQIASALHVANINRTQLVITAYMLGVAIAQLVYGSLADRFGRRPVLLFGVAVYTLFGFLAGAAPNLEVMIAMRAIQGAGAAAARVIAVSTIRDQYSGKEMARVTSLAMIIFIATPILAPSIGQAIVLFLPWRFIFYILACFGIVVFTGVWLFLPETLHPQDRLPLSAGPILRAFRTVITERISAGYTVAATAVMGSMFGFVHSAQGVFVTTLKTGRLFPIFFASIALSVGLSAMVNSKLVLRYGARRMSHTALLGLITMSAIHTAISAAGIETLWLFMPIQMLQMFCVGLTGANFQALAMESMGHIAGTASSAQGFFNTLVAVIIGFGIGQCFNGTTLPMSLGFLTMGTVALASVLISERGHLFRHHT